MLLLVQCICLTTFISGLFYLYIEDLSPTIGQSVPADCQVLSHSVFRIPPADGFLILLRLVNLPSSGCGQSKEVAEGKQHSVRDFPRNEIEVELHLHLDGSLSPSFIARRALVRGVTLPASPERLRGWLMDRKLHKLRADDNKAVAGGNWPVFDFCNQFLQTELELREATLDLLSRLAEDGVVYAEIRFVFSESIFLQIREIF